MAESNPSTEQHDELDDLLESSVTVRERRLGRREFVVEASLTAGFLAVAIALASTAAGQLHLTPALLAVVVAYALTSRVAYPLGVGNLVPTQPFFVAFFALAPAATVPLMAYAGLLLGCLIDVVTRRSHPERLTFAGGDAVYSLGPVAVLVVAGVTDIREAALLLLPLAFAAQLAFDLCSSVLRVWVSCGLRPQMQIRAFARVAAMDLALTPLGILAGLAVDETAAASLLMLPFVGLLAFTARDRLAMVRRAHARLVELERERHRLRLAVQRIGEAFASNLDLDALLQIVTRASVEALDATGGRATSCQGPDRKPLRRATVGGGPEVDAVLGQAEAALLAAAAPTLVAVDGGAALACRIADDENTFGTVAVARPGRPFEQSERHLLAYLCEQALVSAANVQRHETLHRQALTDELTGLVNHRRFQELLSAMVERHDRTDAPGALVLLDLDNFKEINDVHGHQTGDMVLRAVGRSLRAECRAADEPARYGGEEFAVALAGVDIDAALAHAERMRQAIDALELNGAHGEPLRVTVSVGVAALGDRVKDKPALLAVADGALYRAKRAGKNRVARGWGVDTPNHLAVGLDTGAEVRSLPPRGTKEGDLRAALAQGELFLEYQPLVRLSNGEITGMEALVRWNHPQRGPIPPTEFVPFAERCGLIVPLGAWVLEQACRQGAEWLERWPDLRMSVNVSGAQVEEPTFVSSLVRTLKATGFPADQLVLELTETVLVEDIDLAIASLGAVRDMGVTVAADDFGTGHSSLEYLLKLPLDVVKLPRVFVDGSIGSEHAKLLGQSIMQMAQRLNLTVVAEGIEQHDQLDWLRELGCEVGQGFLLAPPASAMVAEEFVALSAVRLRQAPQLGEARASLEA
jgi:diguanylate cyclase (GGDEF)-like protein